MAKTWVAEKVVDALAVAPNSYKVLLENDGVRVLELTQKPGQKISMHAHPTILVYAIEDSKAEFIFPDGKTQNIFLRKGQTFWSGPFSHATENTGSSDIRVLIVELKRD